MTTLSIEDARAQLAGAMVSVATPATDGFDLDIDAYRRNIEFMIDNGLVAGNAVLLVAAAGGEFPMLSVAERKELMTVAVEVAAGRVPIAASVQSNSTREAIELASYASAVGISVGQLSAPSYYPPTPADIEQLFKDVAGASGLPLMIYNNWWNTANMNSEIVLRLAEIDGVVALKWSAPTFEQYAAGYELFSGRLAIVDNSGQRVSASMFRADGFITHVGNFWPAYCLQIWELLRERRYDELNEANAFEMKWARWTERVNEFTEGEGPFVKAALDEVGLASGDPFPPGLKVPTELRAELRQLFDEYGVPRTGDSVDPASTRTADGELAGSAATVTDSD